MNTAIQFFNGTIGVNKTPFVSVWKTDNLSTGSSGATSVRFELVYLQIYNCVIDWGDGSTSTYVNESSAIAHNYTSAGTYTITVTPTKGTFPGIAFDNSGDRLKILEISQWGDYRVTTHSNFFGCSNLDVTAEDAPIFGTTTGLQDMFRNCSKLVGGNGFALWDVSGQVQAIRTFLGCVLFNGNIEPWNVGNITQFTNFLNGCQSFTRNIGAYWNISPIASTFLSMFSGASSYNHPILFNLTSNPSINITLQNFLYGAIDFDHSLGHLNMVRVNNMTDFLRDAGISTVNYDSTLSGWAAQNLRPNVTVNMGNSKYSPAGAAARQHIIDTYNWTITDGGPV